MPDMTDAQATIAFLDGEIAKLQSRMDTLTAARDALRDGAKLVVLKKKPLSADAKKRAEWAEQKRRQRAAKKKATK